MVLTVVAAIYLPSNFGSFCGETAVFKSAEKWKIQELNLNYR